MKIKFYGENYRSQAFMTSAIGDLPVNSEGLRKAIDEISRLRAIIKNNINAKPIEMDSDIGVLQADATGLRIAIDEISKCHKEIAILKRRLDA